LTSQQPDPIWVPTGRDIAAAGITAFAEHAAAARGYRGQSYLDLWRWSVEHLDDFWAAVWDHFDVRSPTPYRAVRDGAMPSVRWFDGAQVSYVEHLFRDRFDDVVAIVDVAECAAAGLRVRRLTWAQLRAEVATVAALLQQLGVSRGDRVAAYVPNTAEAVVGFLAAAALGAVWSACGQDYGPGAAAQRLAQLEPIVLIAADGYRYGGSRPRPPRRGGRTAPRVAQRAGRRGVQQAARRRRLARRRHAVADRAGRPIPAPGSGAVRTPAVGTVLLGNHRPAQRHRA